MVAIKTGWTIEYVQSLPASTFEDIKDIMSGLYDNVEEGGYEVRRASKSDSVDDLTRLIREAEKNGNSA